MKQTVITLSLLLLQSFLIFIHAQKNTTNQHSINDSNIYCFTISDDGQVLYYANENKIAQYNLVNNTVGITFNIQVDSPVISILVEPNKNAIILGTKSGKVVAISNGSGELLSEIDHKAGSINAMAITSDENYLLCGCENGIVYKHSITDINTFTEFHEKDTSITSIEVSNEKQLIAISSGDGSISLFNEQTNELTEKIFVQNEWVRKVAINNNKERLLCVTDDGNLYEWNISDISKSKLLSQTKVSKNWLLSLDIGQDGNIECWGGLDHLLKVRTLFGTYEKRLKGPILKAKFIKTESSEIIIVCCVLGKGIRVVPVKEMKFKSIYN